MHARAESTAVTVLCVHPGAELFGSDRMFLESVAGIRAAGCEVTVLVPQNGPLVERLAATGARVRITPMLVLRKSLLSPRNWGRLLASAVGGFFRSWGTARRARPDVIYTSTITIPHWPLIARLVGARSVSHVHEAEASGSKLVNRVMYAPHLASATVIVNSEFSLRTIAATLPRLSRRAEVIYNGVEGARDAELPRPELDRPVRAAYVGRLSPRKGPDLLLQAAATLREKGHDVRVDLIGDVFTGYEWYEQELREQAARAEVGVDFHGFVADIWPLVAQADVLVVPSRLDEPFGNTAVEGILALRPVIASDTSGLREAAGGYPTTFLVTPDDASALAQALERVSAEWTTIRAQLQVSAARAEARHSTETYRREIAARVAAKYTDPN